MTRQRTYGPDARLPVAVAARLHGVAETTISAAMDEWTKSKHTRGLRHVDEGETRDGRRIRWTKREWLNAWEVSLSERAKRQRKILTAPQSSLITNPSEHINRKWS